MLDSGAFTAWKSRKSVPLKEVIEYYSRFLRESDGLFDSVWLINLDVITDDHTTGEQRTEAFRRSDENFRALTAEFGNRVLPVFHQGEGKDRLREILDQADGFLCLSPNNKKPEDHRYRWTRLANYAVRDMGSKGRAHGLATTENVMIREAGLFSGDSAAWVEHGKFGTVDLVQAEFADNIEIQKIRAPCWKLEERKSGRASYGFLIEATT